MKLGPSQAVLRIATTVALSISSLWGQDSHPVTSELQTEEAWMGQEVKLIVTLHSPGPFSGTARFQLPEIPDTVIIRSENPVVGSNTVKGQSLITQRHEFRIFTQQIGTVEIPAIPIEYESKDDFLGGPIERNGTTEAVSFESKQPPGTEGLDLVVTSASLKVEQKWSPAEPREFEAGAVLTRTITRTANDISAMILTSFPPPAIDGIRYYSGDPQVVDKKERGVVTASRTDILKYQFVAGGEIALPEISYAWWNPKTGKVERVTLEGVSVSVTAPPTPPEPVNPWRWAWISLLAGLAAVVGWRWGIPWIRVRARRWHEKRHSPEAVAGRVLVAACRSNDAQAAYTAFTDWRRATGWESPLLPDLEAEVADLSSRLYRRSDSSQSSWSGTKMEPAFRAELRSRKRAPHRQKSIRASLAPLNPGPAHR